MTENGTPVIQTAGLTKVFKDFWHRARVTAVRNLDLEVHRGEVFGLLGPNGSGKSTTIKMILGLLYPTRGRIAVLGKPPTDVAVKGRIGYLPEETYLYPFLNARETLDYYGRLFQLPRKERARRIDMLLDMVGLANEQRRRLGEYSKGMARRIGLAQALINDPEFLILDEPTAGLDPIGTRPIKDLILDLGRKGKTILLSSHLLGDVEDVCHRVSILYGGQQQKAGDIRQLLAREEFTQIVAPRLSEATIDRIREVIREAGGQDNVQVSAPSDKLEDLFLRIVREADSRSMETSGARLGGNVPEFLSDHGQPRGVIDELMAAVDRPDEPPTPEEPEPVAPVPEGSVIESLVDDLSAPTSAAGDAAEPAAPSPAAPPKADADRGLLDSLLEAAEPEDDTRE